MFIAIQHLSFIQKCLQMLNSRKATKVKGKFVKKSLTQKTEKRLKPNERSARTPMLDRLWRKSGI